MAHPADPDPAEPDLMVVAFQRIDAANAEDPNLVPQPDGPARGELRPKEVVHAERMSHWLLVLDPDASREQRLAARAHHFRRWTWPRSEYPEGRAGYLRWRKAARAGHAAQVDALLADVGIPGAERAATAAIITKDGFGTDPRVQTHEDALCLTFFELQGVATVQKLGEDADRVLVKTVAKMSPQARSIAATFDLPASVIEIILSNREEDRV